MPAQTAHAPAHPAAPARPAGNAATDVLIAGGGIAGLAAAVRLSQAGVRVTLLETRKKLGGRATSFTDPRTGETIDNCQHVALACCTNFIDFLSRLGVADRLRWDREQYWIEPGGAVSTVAPAWLPAPLHFTRSLIDASFLNRRELVALGLAAPAILRADRARWVSRTFGQFLRIARQPQSVIDKFWSAVVVSACNLTVDRVSAASALKVFQDGFFASTDAATIGIATVPLVELYDAAESVIAAAGGRIRLGTGVARLDAHTLTTTAGERLAADRVICALPPDRAADVIDPALMAADRRLPALARAQFSPILGVHLEFDRPVLRTPHAVLVNAPTQWLFRKDDAGRVLHAVISAADDWIPLDEAAIAQRVLADVRAYIPGAAGARLVRARSVKEKRATFAATPEFEAIRPGPVGPSGVILAGDYTATDWPATMEGAARSGYAAAAAVLGRPAADLLSPDLPISPLARALGLRRQDLSRLHANDHVSAAIETRP